MLVAADAASSFRERKARPRIHRCRWNCTKIAVDASTCTLLIDINRIMWKSWSMRALTRP
jgi:hypothetical protein